MFRNKEVLSLLRTQSAKLYDKKLREKCNEFMQEYYYELPDTEVSIVMNDAVELYQEAIKTVK